METVLKTLVILQLGAPFVIFMYGTLKNVISLIKAIMWSFSIFAALIGMFLSGASPIVVFFLGVFISPMLPLWIIGSRKKTEWGIAA